MNSPARLSPRARFTASTSASPVSPTTDDIQVPDLTDQLEELQSTPIGNGGYSDVYLYRSRGTALQGAENRIFAVKTARIKFFVGNREKAINRLRREIGVWTALDHENVLKLHGSLTRDNHPLPSLVSDYMENGTAENYLRENAEANFIRLIHEIAKGLSYLHREDIAHGDIKANNILIGRGGTARVGDFGLSRMLDDDGLPHETTTTDNNRSSRWTAVEYLEMAMSDTPRSPRSFGPTKAGDVWSFGCTVLELFSGKLPYYDAYEVEVVLKLHRKELPKFPPTLLREEFEKYRAAIFMLCQFCWVKDPKERSPMSVIETVICSYRSEGDYYSSQQPISFTHTGDTTSQETWHGSYESSEMAVSRLEQLNDETDVETSPQSSSQSTLISSLDDDNHKPSDFNVPLQSDSPVQQAFYLDPHVIPDIRMDTDPEGQDDTVPAIHFPDLPPPSLEARIMGMNITPQEVLNELAHKRRLSVQYKDEELSGPSNSLTHEVRCLINRREYGVGRVQAPERKKVAKQRAALAALETLCEEDPAQYPTLRYHPVLVQYLRKNGLESRAIWSIRSGESNEDTPRQQYTVTFSFDGNVVADGVGSTLEKAEEDVARRVGMAWSDAGDEA